MRERITYRDGASSLSKQKTRNAKADTIHVSGRKENTKPKNLSNSGADFLHISFKMRSISITDIFPPFLFLRSSAISVSWYAGVSEKME